MNTRSLSFSLLTALTLGAAGCGGDISGAPDAGQVDAEPPPPPPPPIECENPPPQLAVVLDRSGSFARRPDGTLPPNTEAGKAETRWHIMIEAIRTVTSTLQDEIQFGLTLFPYDPDGEDGLDCSNLDTWLAEYLPPESNDLSCQPGEVLVTPGEMTAAVVDSALSRDDTGLCSTTPIGSGLAAAKADLDAIADPMYEQAAILITDGADNCDGDEGYSTNSLATADAMAAEGIRVYVLGFSGSGEDFEPGHLNDLACAGGTAPSFQDNCEQVDGAYRAKETLTEDHLFYTADELDSLNQALSEIAEDACNDPDIRIGRRAY